MTFKLFWEIPNMHQLNQSEVDQMICAACISLTSFPVTYSPCLKHSQDEPTVLF